MIYLTNTISRFLLPMLQHRPHALYNVTDVYLSFLNNDKFPKYGISRKNADKPAHVSLYMSSIMCVELSCVLTPTSSVTIIGDG